MVKIVAEKLGGSSIPLASSPEFATYCGKTPVFSLAANHPEQDFELAFLFSTFNRLREIEHRNGLGHLLDLHLGILDDPEPNAFADAREGRHFLGVHIGVYLSASYLAGHLIARQNTFVGVGTVPSNARSGEISLNAGMREWDDVLDLSRLDIEPRRGQIAIFIRMVAIWFAAHHEWAHVFRGHCDFLRAAGGPAMLSECSSGKFNRPTNKALFSIRRTFEYLADSQAVTSVLGMIAQELDPVSLGGGWQLSLAERRRLLLVAIGLVAGVWHQASSTRVFVDEHPRPSTRFLAVIQAYRREAAALGIEDPLADVTGAIADLTAIGQHCGQLRPVLDQMISVARARKPWDENADVLACPDDLGEALDLLAYRAA